MKKTLAGALGALALLSAQALTAAPATAAVPGPITIDFTDETPGAKANGYSPAGADGVTFTDTSGANLTVADYGNQGNGQALGVNGDDASALEIALPNPAMSLSLAFGNDHPGIVDATDLASLTLFRGATQVGKVLKNVNANDLMDQRIGFSKGKLFNRAVFQYVDAAEVPKNLIEIVDDIRVGPICTIVGTSGNDNLNGTSGKDVICASGGKDTIDAGKGADLIFAGGGRDVVRGGGGGDELNGDAGRDRLLGGSGRDKLKGAKGRDFCDGGSGRDKGTSCEVKRRIP
jgi:Ca2+-binding RTX toxin-like protein